MPVCTVSPCAAGVCRVDDTVTKGYYCDCSNTSRAGAYCEDQINRPCPGGWWGEHVCGPCKCNTKQGYNLNCNQTTGQCSCKDNHYQPVQERNSVCLPCDCYSIGSFSGSCDQLTGQCHCREGVIGRRCDSCSNPYAEVTLKGCEVVYDACPRSFSQGVWWPRTAIGAVSVENCPSPAHGKGSRRCEGDRGGWRQPDMFNCTSAVFIDLRKQLSQLEMGELELNSFISVKMAKNLQTACEKVYGSGSGSQQLRAMDAAVASTAAGGLYWKKSSTLHSGSSGSDDIWLDEFDMDYLSDEVKFTHNRLYGADLLITEG